MAQALHLNEQPIARACITPAEAGCRQTVAPRRRSGSEPPTTIYWRILEPLETWARA